MRSIQISRRAQAGRRILPIALALVAVLAGCSSAAKSGAAVTVTSTVSAPATQSSPPDFTVGLPTGPPPVAAATPTGATTSSSTSSTASSTLDTGPRITTIPAPNSRNVSPIAPVVVKIATGTITDASITTPEGRVLSGSVSADHRTWTSTEPLGYNRHYTIQASATDTTGTSTQTSTFTTLKPRATVFPSFFPNPGMKTIGIGQPLVVIFDKSPVDRAAAERALTVTTVPKVQGSWYWWDDRTVHYRPKDYWKPGTKITVDAKVYGLDLGAGMYGETDRTLKLTVGRSKIAKIDDAAKQMKIYVDGKLTQTVPVSMGMDKAITVNGKKISFVTPSGIYVAQERYKVKQMSSASYGLPTTYDLGYDSAIPLAVRISNSGIFVHSAPWSVKDQGVRNVSHGCININPTAAKWFYDNFSYGDIVEITGTSTKLGPKDGFGDWNIPWEQWRAGSALN